MDARDGAAASMESESGMQFFGYPMRGTSQGSILIRSASAFDPPQILPNYLATEYDRLTTVSTVRRRACCRLFNFSGTALGQYQCPRHGGSLACVRAAA